MIGEASNAVSGGSGGSAAACMKEMSANCSSGFIAGICRVGLSENTGPRWKIGANVSSEPVRSSAVRDGLLVTGGELSLKAPQSENGLSISICNSTQAAAPPAVEIAPVAVPLVATVLAPLFTSVTLVALPFE